MQTNKIHNKLSMKQKKKRKEKLHCLSSKINSIYPFLFDYNDLFNKIKFDNIYIYIYISKK